MTQENIENEPETTEEQAAAEETLDALNGGNEMNFVSGETKKPVNRTTLVLFAIIALGGGGLWLMHARTGPQSASANTDAPKKTINQFLSGGPANIKLMEMSLRDTEKLVQQFNHPNVKQIPLGELQMNPFRLVVKSSDDADDPVNKRKLAEQREAVLKQYQTLQLQSIMFGGKNRSCLINNTMYREGQVVNGFTIEKISADTVSVKQDAWRFDLKMAK
jgi:hypothetical protein